MREAHKQLLSAALSVCCLTSKQTIRLDKPRFAHMTRLLMNPPHHLHHGGQLAVFHNCWLLYCITVIKLDSMQI